MIQIHENDRAAQYQIVSDYFSYAHSTRKNCLFDVPSNRIMDYPKAGRPLKNNREARPIMLMVFLTYQVGKVRGEPRHLRCQALQRLVYHQIFEYYVQSHMRLTYEIVHRIYIDKIHGHQLRR